MAALKTILMLGQSNMHGLAPLTEVDQATWYRWTGDNNAVPASLVNYQKIIYGINVWQPQLPCAPYTAAPVPGDTDLIADAPTTDTVLTDAALTLAVDELVGLTLKYTSGAASGLSQTILSNTATTITTAMFAATPVGGDTYTIVGTTTKWYTNSTLVASAHKNKWVECTGGGANAGLARFVSANTVHTVTVDAAWIVVPPASATFQISSAGSQGADSDFLTAASPNFVYNGKFAPLQFYFTNGTTYTYTTGYEWPNYYGLPPANPGLAFNTAFVSPMLEIMWQMRHEFDGDLWVIQMPVPYSFLSVQKGPLAEMVGFDFSWFRSARTNDWNPSSSELSGNLTGAVNPCFYDLFDIFIETILKGAALSWVAANRPGDTIDIQGVFIALGESETTDTSSVRANAAGRNMQILRDTMRSRIKAAGLTSMAEHRIPWVLHGIETTGYPRGSIVNPQYKALEDGDLFTGFVDVDDLATRVADPLHFTGQSYVTIGQRSADKWREIKKREAAATTADADRLTLATLRSKVQTRYERTINTNFLSSDIVNEALNQAHQEVYNTLGDQAWFLRRIFDGFTTTTTTGQIVSLPKAVKRLLTIDRSDQPGVEVPHALVSVTDNGQLQVRMDADSGATYRLHHIVIPKPLSGDSDLSLIPEQYSELVIILTAKRLAESGGNTHMVSIYQNEAERLWKYVKRDCMRYANMQKAALSAGPMLFETQSLRAWEQGFTRY